MRAARAGGRLRNMSGSTGLTAESTASCGHDPGRNGARDKKSNIKLEHGGHLWVQELSDGAKPVGWMTGMTAPKFSPSPEPALSRPRSRKLGLEERLIGDVLDERICLPGLTCFLSRLLKYA